jgi:hypothetical protein
MNKQEIEVLKKYSREIIHLRYKLKNENLGLCLGAGISVELGYPKWDKLVESISLSIGGGELYDVNKPLTITTQLLYSFYRSSWMEKNKMTDIQVGSLEERKINIEWLKIIHKCLYENVPKEIGKITHPYLLDFLNVIENSVMTINYNFDDTIERLLFQKNKTKNINEKTFETVWKPSTQFRRNKGIIYHPNGFLPLNLIEGFSDHFVFAEESFIDQSLDSMAGHYSCLLNHVSRHTLLILGISLNDPTLKQILRQNARFNPGHYHYYVHFIADEKSELKSAEKKAIISTNFKVYNLITLFLNSQELSALGRLLNLENTENFKHIIDRENLPQTYRYYITGAVGSGKSTAVNNLRSLKTFDEWLDPKIDLMEKPAKDLSDEEKETVNKWIDDQFSRKNFNIKDNNFCISVIDRSPIDPLAFQTDSNGKIVLKDVKTRAKELKETYKPFIPKGCVILLNGNPEELLAHVVSRHKNATVKYIKYQQDFLISMFPHNEVYILETRGLSEYEVTKKISLIIFTEKYREIDMNKILEKYIK